MTSNNSGWIMGAPKKPIGCIWQIGLGWRKTRLTKNGCKLAFGLGIPCYRHRPIKKEEK